MKTIFKSLRTCIVWGKHEGQAREYFARCNKVGGTVWHLPEVCVATFFTEFRVDANYYITS